jgi:hypothetical protein
MEILESPAVVAARLRSGQREQSTRTSVFVNSRPFLPLDGQTAGQCNLEIHNCHALQIPAVGWPDRVTVRWADTGSGNCKVNEPRGADVAIAQGNPMRMKLLTVAETAAQMRLPKFACASSKRSEGATSKES